MGQYFFILAVVFLSFTSVTLSDDVVQKRENASHKWVYRCDKKIFSSEFLDSVAQDLQSRIREDLSRESYSPYIHTVDKSFASGVIQNDEFPVMWPLLDSEQSLSEHGGNAVYHALLASKNLRLLDVVQRQPDESLVKCIVEHDLTELSNNLVATGFRCPTELFSFETLRATINAVKAREHLLQSYDSKNSYPPYFDDGNSLFQYPNELFTCRMSATGKLNGNAITSLILNKSYNIIGMTHQKRHTYFRCRLTSNTKIEPRFIGSAPNTQPGEIVVFKCENYFVPLNIALAIAPSAVDGFILKRKHILRKYPAPYSNAPHDGGPTDLYIWPVSFDKKNFAQLGYDGFTTIHRVYLLINDYSDIVDVIVRVRGSRSKELISDFESCDRTTMRL